MQLNMVIEDLQWEAELPPLYRVRQPELPSPLADIAGRVRAELDRLGIAPRVAGKQIALTAGSRGIHDIAAVLRAAVEYLRGAGATPFVVPAMGTHGGATAAGQVTMLAELGLSEARVGCPIRSSMETVEVGQTEMGIACHMDRNAHEADAVLVIGRVKPHTDFHGYIESGLAKMITIGLGKRRGAETVHASGPQGLRELVPAIAKVVVGTGKILCGLAILEDAADHTADVVALTADEIGGAGEHALLGRAKQLIGRLPFEQLDVLVVDEIGKNISGCGMDTNVIGRMRIPGESDDNPPRISIIVALDISKESHGNAAGIGLADITTARLASKIDFNATYINGLISGLGGVQRIALPPVLPSERAALAAAMHCCAQPERAALRLARIKNTLQTREFCVSAALLDECRSLGLELLGEAEWGFEQA
jgi:hypothetical protein